MTDEEKLALENVHEILDRLTKRRKRQLPVSSGLEAMLREVILYRVVSMTGGTIVNWNTGNVLCSFLSARGLFETFAFLWDYDRAIDQAREAGTLAEFRKLSENRLAATRDPKKLDKHPEWESTNILTAINRMSEEYPWAKSAYDVMSHKCHPNSEGMIDTFVNVDTEKRTISFSAHNDNAERAFRIILGVTALIDNVEKILDRLEHSTQTITNELKDRRFQKLSAKSKREREQFEQFCEDERQAFLGDARGQFAMGRALSTGATTVPKDLLRAYFWLSLAAARGSNEAARCRDKIAPKMTSEQIDEAQALAASWKPMTTEEFEKHNQEIVEHLRKNMGPVVVTEGSCEGDD
ncbi:hypothetical protein ACE10W_37120 [Bradyrhizobium sp. B025]|uniref:hypothetical protein n=1 Tax=Bradyrhizobium sp. B025 TaxID=3344829 RepID=UPI0035D4B38D